MSEAQLVAILALGAPLIALLYPLALGACLLAPVGLRSDERTALALPLGIVAAGLQGLAAACSGWAAWGLVLGLPLGGLLVGYRRRGRSSRPWGRFHPLLLRLIVLTFGVYLGVAFVIPVPAGFGLMYGDWLQHYGVAAFLRDVPLQAVERQTPYLVARPVLWNAYSALLFRGLGTTSFAVHQVANAASVAATPAVCWVLASRLGASVRVRNLAALVVVTSSSLLTSAAIFHWPKPLAATLLLGGLLTLQTVWSSGRRDRPRLERALLGGVLVGGAIGVHGSALFFLLPLLVAIPWMPGARAWKARHVGLAALGIAIAVLPYYGWLLARGTLDVSLQAGAGLVQGETGWTSRLYALGWNLSGGVSPVKLVRHLQALTPQAWCGHALWRGALVGALPLTLLLLCLTRLAPGRSPAPVHLRGWRWLAAGIAALLLGEAVFPLPPLDASQFELPISGPLTPLGWLGLAVVLWGAVMVWRDAPPRLQLTWRVTLVGALLACGALKYPAWGMQLVNAGASYALVLALIPWAVSAAPRSADRLLSVGLLLELALGFGVPLVQVIDNGYLADHLHLNNMQLKQQNQIAVLRDLCPTWVVIAWGIVGIASLATLVVTLWPRPEART